MPWTSFPNKNERYCLTKCFHFVSEAIVSHYWTLSTSSSIHLKAVDDAKYVLWKHGLCLVNVVQLLSFCIVRESNLAMKWKETPISRCCLISLLIEGVFYLMIEVNHAVMQSMQHTIYDIIVIVLSFSDNKLSLGSIAARPISIS